MRDTPYAPPAAPVPDFAVKFGTLFGVEPFSNRAILTGHTFPGLTTGYINFAMGGGTLALVTSGSQNTGVGAFALGQLTGGANNMALGTSALSGVTTGSNNTSVGAGTGSMLTTGANNTFVGVQTNLRNSTQRTSTVAVGSAATVDADFAVAIGDTARGWHARSVALGSSSQTTAADQVMVGGRDIEITDATKGVVLKSPNGTRYRVTVSNAGLLSAVAA